MTAEPIRQPDEDDGVHSGSAPPDAATDGVREQDSEAASEGTLTPDAAASAEATASAEADAASIAPAEKARRTVVFLAGARRVLSFSIAFLLFAGGIALGVRAFDSTQTVGPPTASLDPSASPPAVAQEFIEALRSNDADALRSSLDAQPHKDITDEFERFGIHSIKDVETLKTQVDGTRSATEIMMMAENADGITFGINLVILVDGGKIEGFR